MIRRVKGLLPIGRFSQVTRLSPKALRLYDEEGLLRPALVDGESGNRYYALAQAPEAERIRLLRSLEVPLDEIRRYLAAGDAETRRAVLRTHEARIAARVEVERKILERLERLASSEVGTVPGSVALTALCVPVDRPLCGAGQIDGRELPAATVASTLHAGPYDEIGTAYAAVQGFMTERGHETAGPAREIYLVGPGQVSDPASYRTEVQWPVR